MTYPEPIILFFAGPMKVISIITSPFVFLLTSSNNLLLTVLGIKHNTKNAISEAEIKSIIKESAAEGEIEKIEQSIVNRVFELGDRKVNTLYTNRKDVVFIDESYSWKEVLAAINEEKHTAYPVTKNQNPDDIIGLLMIKNLFSPDIQNNFNILNYLTEPMYVNESCFAYQVLEQFKAERKHHALVVDEFGVFKGLVTMDDVLDALVGDTIENPDQEYRIVQRDENSWLIDGQYALPDFLRHFPVSISDKELSENATIAGLIIYRSENVPIVGKKISLPPYDLEVIDKDGQRIDKFLLTFKPANGG
jgi:putative hemolysin